MSSGGSSSPITVLRDSGALQVILCAGITDRDETGERVILSSLGGMNSAPLRKVTLHTTCFSGMASVAVVPELPVKGVDLILGE